MKTLLERIECQFNKVGITFILKNETYYKYVGAIKDIKTGEVIPHDISKNIQVNLISQEAKLARNMMDMYIKIKEKNKNEIQ